MSSRSKFVCIGVGFAIAHFLATWFVVIQAWEHDWAARLMRVMMFPGRLTSFGGGKLSNMALMFFNSLLWGLLFAALAALVWRSFRRRQHD